MTHLDHVALSGDNHRLIGIMRNQSSNHTVKTNEVESQILMNHKGRIGDKPAFKKFQESLSINRLPPQQSLALFSIPGIKSPCFSCHTATSLAFIHQFSFHTNPRSMNLSLLIKQRLALAVRRLRMSNATEQTVTTVVPGSRNINGSHQENAEDDNGEDPLQSNDLDGELAEGQSWKTESEHYSLVSNN